MPFTSSLESLISRAKALFTNLVSLVLSLLTLPYRAFYRRNTYNPLYRIASAVDTPRCHLELEAFFRTKLREAQYVKVAGALIFGATIACLSWSTPLTHAHWSGPALWYASIILSLTSIVPGAQQTIAIPDLQASTTTNGEPRISEAYALGSQRRLTCHIGKKKHDGRLTAEAHGQPKRMMLFVWQTPLMLFTYSVAFFLAGLSSVVVSPLVGVGGAWGVEAKTVVVYVVAVMVGCGTFAGASWGLYEGLRRSGE